MILDEIAVRTKQRVSELKKEKPLSVMMTEALLVKNNKSFCFEKALESDGISFICEVKKASPSKGVIAENFPFSDIAKEYESAGAAAVSVLTEPYYFKGNNDFLKEIKNSISIPVLRKDFTVDDYMIYEAKTIGADAVLLICSLLDEKELGFYLEISHGLGLSALVEAHDETEIEKALTAGAKIVGVNNRNLNDFSVDINNSLKLKKYIPEDVIYVSESGIKTREDIRKLEENKTNAVLIGESLMRSKDKKAQLKYLRGELNA